MRRPGLFYATPYMVNRWGRGRHWPGVYFVFPNGRARVILPTGPRVTSMYGIKRENDGR